MLFTRCPGCETTFRITADTLRVANGAVRCGHCATVFSAYSGLRQDSLNDDMRQDDEFLSPTLQTQELASIEEIASPEFDAGDVPVVAEEGSEPHETGDDAAECAPELAEEAHEPADAPMPAESTTTKGDAHASPPEPPEPEPTAEGGSEPRAPQEPSSIDEAAFAEIFGTPRPAEDSSDKLQFEAPADEWAALLSEIEKSVEGDGDDDDDQSEEPADEVASADSPLPDDGEGLEPWDISEPFSLETWDTTGERRRLGPSDGEKSESQSSEGAASVTATRTDPADIDLDEAISAEEIDATLSTEPDPDLIAALEESFEHRSSETGGSRRWAIGSIALIVLLGAQAVHHFRAPLARQPVIGAVLEGVYGLAGVELVPDWDLEQYEITNWAATAGSGNGGPGNLHITAQIRNRGPRAQPYPSIQLELKDRWEAVIGSRVFVPGEYLGERADGDELMSAGSTAPADLLVVDPGLDASGFELDVCLEGGDGRMRCAGDRVFE